MGILSVQLSLSLQNLSNEQIFFLPASFLQYIQIF